MTNDKEIGARTSIERQARQWLVRMDGDVPLGNVEKEALKEWLGRSPLHRAELMRIAQFWDQANILTDLVAALESQGRQRAGRRCGGQKWTFLMAAVCASVSSLILAYCSMWQLGATDTRTYRTDTGEQKTILLPDGSSIHLNTNSERSIRLTRGEGRFCVAPDPSRPFEVCAADSSVRAGGYKAKHQSRAPFPPTSVMQLTPDSSALRRSM